MFNVVPFLTALLAIGIIIFSILNFFQADNDNISAKGGWGVSCLGWMVALICIVPQCIVVG